MLYQDFLQRDTLDHADLLALGYGRLLDDPPPGWVNRTPTPPLLMFDRVTQVDRSPRGGAIVAEQDLRVDAWYFHCHFVDDPVQPGCLGLDALWQLLGLWLALTGAVGSGRALGCGEVEFGGQIRPHDQLVRYELSVKRRLARGDATLCVADGSVSVDGDPIYTARDLRVGLFSGIAYDDYPRPSPLSRGGQLRRGGA